MAKTKATKPAAPTAIDVRYDLLDLPSSQHKAGLAGLLLQVEDMRERREKGLIPGDRDIPEILETTATTATVRFTAKSVQTLFDDLYHAIPVERWMYKWPKDKKGKPKREEPEEVTDARGRKSIKVRLYFDDADPSSYFIARYTEGANEIWHKLWRDMIYAVPRNKPTTRQAYKSRAEGQPTKEGSEAWKALLASEKAKTEGTIATTELAGSLMLAVQAVTAEAVRFEDRATIRILLHFWSLTARIYVPRLVDEEGKGRFVGYTLAIPEVANLGEFCDSYKHLLNQLDPKPLGYRPWDAVIALPEQGPLEFLYHLDRIAAEKSLAGKTAKCLSGVEFFYMVDVDKGGRRAKDVKLWSHGRIPIEETLLEEYGQIRRRIRNPGLLTGLLRALLRKHPWFEDLDGPLQEQDWPRFVHAVSTQKSRRTPSEMIGFAWEVAGEFRILRERYRDFFRSEEFRMGQVEPPPEAVDAILYELVRVYVREKACRRASIKHHETKDWWDRTADERRDVCAKLFLEFRSRHGDDFVGYFTDTIASVAQWLDEGQFLAVSRALMRPHPDPKDAGPDRRRCRDDVKTLTMLALSAHSRSLKTRSAEADATDADTPTENAG